MEVFEMAFEAPVVGVRQCAYGIAAGAAEGMGRLLHMQDQPLVQIGVIFVQNITDNLGKTFVLTTLRLGLGDEASQAFGEVVDVLNEAQEVFVQRDQLGFEFDLKGLEFVESGDDGVIGVDKFGDLIQDRVGFVGDDLDLQAHLLLEAAHHPAHLPIP